MNKTLIMLLISTMLHTTFSHSMEPAPELLPAINTTQTLVWLQGIIPIKAEIIKRDEDESTKTVINISDISDGIRLHSTAFMLQPPGFTEYPQASAVLAMFPELHPSRQTHTTQTTSGTWSTSHLISAFALGVGAYFVTTKVLERSEYFTTKTVPQSALIMSSYGNKILQLARNTISNTISYVKPEVIRIGSSLQNTAAFSIMSTQIMQLYEKLISLPFFSGR